MAMIINFCIGAIAGICFGLAQKTENPFKRAFLCVVGVILMTIVFLIAYLSTNDQ